MIYQSLLTLVIIMALGIYFKNYLENRNEYEQFSNLLTEVEHFDNKKSKDTPAQVRARKLAFQKMEEQDEKKIAQNQKKSSMDTQNDEVRKQFYDGMDCPVVFERNGEFIVVVKPNSCWAKKYSKHGETSYGKNRVYAREIFLRNFPTCSLPRILRPGGHKPNRKNCPFIVEKNNPCSAEVCHGHNWGNNTTKNNMSKQCRRQIIHYCTKNANLDPACICWQPEYRNTKACKQVRNVMYDADNYNCSVNIFNIEDHPAFLRGDYIKVDEIPCYGCNLKQFVKNK